MQDRVFLTMGGRNNGKEMFMRICGNNPGCMQFCSELKRRNNGNELLMALLQMDLTGSRAYQLWNDCCNRDTDAAAEIIEAYMAGKISADEIHEHTDQGWGTAFDMEELRTREGKKPAEGFLKARHGMQILGRTPEGTCPECAVAHDPGMPHNCRSMAYQYHFYDQHGRWPTWRDAMEHCDDVIKEQWIKALQEKGVNVDGQ